MSKLLAVEIANPLTTEQQEKIIENINSIFEKLYGKGTQNEKNLKEKTDYR